MTKTISIILFAFVVLSICGGLFYWFEYRPSEIRKQCSWKEFKPGEWREAYDKEYVKCLQQNGLQK